LPQLREGFEAWRRLGPVRGTVKALALAVRVVRVPLRRLRLRVRPLRARAGFVRVAMGGDAGAVLEQRVLPALPAVAAFERRLDGIGSVEREALVARAEAVAAHRFDLLGSGPVELGARIDWQRDFKSGRSWPLEHISRVPIVFPDDSDIKVPWELSRGQHLPLLAAAWRVTGERRFLDAAGAQLEAWIDGNPVEMGANWACTMDVAIRAANWVATLALLRGAVPDATWSGRVMESLLLHGRFIRSHLEWAEVRGNHYLSDVVGLLPLAALFGGGREGRDWASWGARELEAEMTHQVRPDGCDHEASIPYHRLVCELFVCGTQAVDALLPGRLSEGYRSRLRLMLGFVRDYTRPDGLAPQVGDADDGRVLPLGGYGDDPRSHLHLFEQAGSSYEPAAGHAAYPEGGYWVMRAGGLYAIVRCGDVGVGGLGSHAHNDQLSLELALGEQPMVIDPGSYLYTADLAARALFRSTGFHSTLRIGGAEQNELDEARPFGMDDQTRSEAIGWEPAADGAAFEGMHHGYERLDAPATHRRRLALDGPGRSLTVRDTVSSDGAHELEWTFPLARCDAHGGEGRAVAEFEGGTLEVESEGLRFEVDEGWYSPSYGVRERVPFLRARRRGRPGTDVTTIVLRARERA
jgi:hypothetical protein